MQCGVFPTLIEGAIPYFQKICVILGWLGEFHLWLMLDNVKNLVNQQLQGVKIEASSDFTVVGEAFSLCVGA